MFCGSEVHSKRELGVLFVFYMKNFLLPISHAIFLRSNYPHNFSILYLVSSRKLHNDHLRSSELFSSTIFSRLIPFTLILRTVFLSSRVSFDSRSWLQSNVVYEYISKIEDRLRILPLVQQG